MYIISEVNTIKNKQDSSSKEYSLGAEKYQFDNDRKSVIRLIEQLEKLTAVLFDNRRKPSLLGRYLKEYLNG